MDKYRVIKALNDRNSVFLVENNDDNKLWVMKIIEEESINVYKRLLNIVHPNIAFVKEIIKNEKGIFVIEEYIEGQTLDNILEDRVLSESCVKNYICQLCDALCCIHRLGIVHRDITPNNIIIGKNESIKLIDMGISRIVKKNKSSDTVLMGTQGYVSPEQFGFKQTNERSDIFSLGVLMNVMLTGKFPNDNLYNKNSGFKQAIKRATEIDLNKRYKNVREFGKNVRALPTEGDSSFIKFIKELPCFRSRTWYKMAVGVCFYLFLVFLIGVDFYVFFDSRLIDFILFTSYIVVGVFGSYLVAGNYKYYIDNIRLIDNWSYFWRRVLCAFLGGTSFILLFFLLTDLL